MKNLLGKAALVFLGFFLIFVCLEVVVRVLNNTSPEAIFTPDPAIVRKYLPNYDEIVVFEDVTPVRFKTNELGFAGPSFRNEKDAGVLRIASLGDSFTAAAEVDFDKKHSALIGTQLNEMGIKTESLNFGVAGQGTAHAVETYRTYVRPAHPDLVILWFFLGNDFEDNLIYEEGGEVTTNTDEFFVKRIARKSALAYFVVDKLAHIPAVAKLMHGTVLTRVGNDALANPDGLPLTVRLLFTDDKENEKAVGETHRYLKDLHDEVSLDGAKLLIAAVPVSYQVSPVTEAMLVNQYPALPKYGFDLMRPRLILNGLVNELGIDYIDLSEDFTAGCSADPVEDRCILYNCAFCHLSPSGHERAASLVVERLMSDPALFKNGL